MRRSVPLATAGAWLGAIASGLAQTAGDDQVVVYSPRADSVAVTIYPDDLALITEIRTVDLPTAAATLVIQDVADTLLPQSAIVNGLARSLAESNFDYNRLSPHSLLSQAVGQTVTLLRTDPSTGTVSRLPATVIAAGDGVVLETDAGHEALYCSGLAEGIVFDAIPDNLYARPQLSARLAAGESGERTIRVSYLAHGLSWRADYVATLDERSESLDLLGWATVTNSSGRVFEQAELQLVAGQLNVLPSDDGGSRAERVSATRGESQIDARERLEAQGSLEDALLLRECFEAPVPELGPRYRDVIDSEADFQTVMVTGSRVPREEFGDYHLYRLPWRTDLGARQTKQVRFLDQDGVSVESFYAVHVAGVGSPYILGGSIDLRNQGTDGSGTFATAPIRMIRTENTAENGLGEPLPSGRVGFFQTEGDGSILIGYAGIPDRPVGAEVDIEVGRALDLLVDVDLRVESSDPQAVLAADYRALNVKSSAIDLEVRHFLSGETDFTVEASSHPYAFRGSYVAWRLAVPPGAETLSYRVSSSD